MTYSMNEVESMVKKAARGADYNWGASEEAAKATRWLCERGVDGCAALANLLKRMDRVSAAQSSPNISDQSWAASGDALCPIAAGTALSDLANQYREREIQLNDVVQPVLLVPFVAAVAQVNEQTTTIVCDDAVATTDGRDVAFVGDFPSEAAILTISPKGKIAKANPCTPRAAPDLGAWEVLTRLAHRTYAPATEESRMKGAGAGLSDND